jgi:hypothetical protein
MTKWRKASIPAAILAAVSLVPLAATPASAETFREEIEFANVHNCTGETVQGDVWVKMTITTTDNGDGSTTVRIHQHTHGQQLLGLVSNDWYVFNEGEDRVEEFTIFGGTGTVVSRTDYIHTTEDLAFQEEPGKDDFHQRLSITFSPLLPPVVNRADSDCR